MVEASLMAVLFAMLVVFLVIFVPGWAVAKVIASRADAHTRRLSRDFAHNWLNKRD